MGLASVIKRSQSTFYRSMEDGLRSEKPTKPGAMTRSESRPSFRDMAREGFKSAGNILEKMRKKSSNASSPYLLSTLDVTCVGQVSSSGHILSSSIQSFYVDRSYRRPVRRNHRQGRHLPRKSASWVSVYP